MRKDPNIYTWVVYLHIVAIFIFLVQDAAEIWVTFRIRGQKEPEGIFATDIFMPDNIVRNLRITYCRSSSPGSQPA